MSFGLLNKLFYLILNFFSPLCSTEGEGDVGECEENLMTPTETTSPPSGPSGLVIFGRLVQKHSYVSGLIIMMVNLTTNNDL